jgi:hypothetical protein
MKQDTDLYLIFSVAETLGVTREELIEQLHEAKKQNIQVFLIIQP